MPAYKKRRAARVKRTREIHAGGHGFAQTQTLSPSYSASHRESIHVTYANLQTRPVYWFELIYPGQRYQRNTRVKNQRVAGEIAFAFHTALAKGDVGITERKQAPQFTTARKDFLT